MEKVFIELLNMGLTATWVILAVLAVRTLCYKAPKALIVSLWALVGVRLVCPILAESILSLLPSGRIISPEILFAETPSIYTGVSLLNSSINPMISEHLSPTYSASSVPSPGASVNPLQVVACVATIVWIAGMCVMFTYSLVSYLWLRHKVKVSLCYRGNIYFCDSIATPFVFGLMKPRIYIPSGMEEGQVECVIAHESAHLRRKDHWWKSIAFFLLSVYWFHPLLWVAYLLFSRDIERACDERVVREMDAEARKGYAEALVSCSLQKRMMLACPLAFGEVGVKNRVKSVLNYKKPAFWLVAATVVAGVAIAVCFLTNPVPEKDRMADVYGVSVIGSADGPTAVFLAGIFDGGKDSKEDSEVAGTVDFSGGMYGTEEEGLYVFIWQLGEDSYSCCVLDKTEEGYTTEELWRMQPVRLADARQVVKDSGYQKEAVTIVPYSMPYSGYLNLERMEDPEGYLMKLEELFWGE